MDEAEQLDLFGCGRRRLKPRAPRRSGDIPRTLTNYRLGLIDEPERPQLDISLPDANARPALWLNDPYPTPAPLIWAAGYPMRSPFEPLAWARLPFKRFITAYQRTRVYRRVWEQTWSAAAPLTLEACADLARRLTGLANLEARPGRVNALTAWASRADRVLTLPPGMRTPAVVAHEAAHLRSFDLHCPGFVRGLCRFLELADLIPEADAPGSAHAFGIDVAPCRLTKQPREIKPHDARKPIRTTREGRPSNRDQDRKTHVRRVRGG